jgi:uncharacterized protein
MKLCPAIACLFLFVGTLAQPQTASQAAGQQRPPAGTQPVKIDPAKEADIRKLMELTGAAMLAKQTMDRMVDGLRPLMISALPPGEYRGKLVDLFVAKFLSRADPKQVLDIAVPIYDKYFSQEEVKGLIQFYQTPLGQKAVSALPKLVAELGDAGRQWGRQLGQEAMQDVLAENPVLAQALEAARKVQR